jgi:hypothetical protein
MGQFKIPFSGRFRISGPVGRCLHPHISYAPALNPEDHQLDFVGVDDWHVWLVEPMRMVTTQEVARLAPMREAVFGDWSALVWVMLRLAPWLPDVPVVAPAPLLEGRDACPFARVRAGRIEISLASGKPYWANDCLFLYMAPM